MSGDRSTATFHSSAARDSQFERFLVHAERIHLEQIAAINPDVALQLALLSHFSFQGTPPMPTQGDARFTRLHTGAGIQVLIDRGVGNVDLSQYSTPLPASAEISLVKFAMSKQSQDDAELSMSHRLLLQESIEKRTANPDIVISLKWIPAGRAGYWKTSAWRIVP